MKIGVVSNLYPPLARGGAEQIALRVAHELYWRGHEVFIISTMPYDGIRSLVGRVTERSVEAVYRYYPLNVYHMLDAHTFAFPIRVVWHLTDLWNPIPGRAVRSVLRDERPDILLTHNLKGMGLQLCKQIRQAGIKQIHTLHDVQLSIPSGLLIYGKENALMNRFPIRPLYERAIQSVVGSPDIVISPSRFLSDFYRARGFFPQSRVEVMPNPAPNLRSFTRPGRQPGPLRLLFAGQLEEHKGIRMLYEVLRDSHMDFELHVAGEGTLAGWVSDCAEKDRRMTHHGFMSFENLVNLFAISDAVVVPSLCYENSPTIIYESFQAGIPVIASNIGGVGELVRDGVNGYLVKPGDRAELLEAIRRMGQNETEFRAREEAIRSTVEPYALPTYVTKLEGMMQELKPTLK